jgi:hypothetical protein
VAFRRLEEWLRALSADASGLPPTHAASHLAGGSDALETPGTPSTVTVNVGADAGDGPSFALEDHAHALDLGLTTKGDLLVRTATAYARLPAGRDGLALVANSSVPEGVAWDEEDEAVNAEFLAWLGIMGWGS